MKGYLGVDPKTGKQKDTVLRGFKNKTAAEKAFADAQYKFRHGVKKAAKAPTIREAYELWMPIYAPTVAPSTVRTVKTVYDKRILPAVGDRYVDKFSLVDAQRLATQFAEKYRSYRQSIACLSALFKFAVHNKWIDASPFYYIQWPRKSKAVSHHVTDNNFALEEMNTFLATIHRLGKEDPAWQSKDAFLTLLATTGMRNGEATALKWSEVDFDKKTVTISRHVQVTEAGVTIAEGAKSKAGVRKLSLDDVTLGILKRWQVRQAMLAGVGAQWVFTAVKNPKQRVSDHAPVFWMHEACKAAGLRYISPHGLRHTKASLMSESGTGPADIAAILGHSSIRTTESTYLHANSPSVLKAENEYYELIESGSKSGSVK